MTIAMRGTEYIKLEKRLVLLAWLNNLLATRVTRNYSQT